MNQETKLGLVFDSSLASNYQTARLVLLILDKRDLQDSLTLEQQEHSLPCVLIFIVELHSPKVMPYPLSD